MVCYLRNIKLIYGWLLWFVGLTLISFFTFAFPIHAAITPVIHSIGTGSAAPSSLRSLVRTSDGTLHSFIGDSNSTTCAGQSRSGLLWFYSTDSGSTWTCGEQISSDVNVRASAVVDASDNIYVTYSLTSNGGGTTNDTFFAKLNKGAGSTWTLGSGHTVLDASSGIGYTNSTIEAQGTTRLWLATRYFDGTNYQVSTYYSNGMSPAASGDWTLSKTSLETPDTATSHLPAIVRFGSKIGVAYVMGSNELHWSFRSDSDGLTTWSNDSTVNVASVTSTTVNAVGDTNGRIYLSAISGNNAIFQYYNGAAWSSSATVSTTSSASLGISVTTDGTSVWITYGDTTGFSTALPGNRKIVYKKGVAPFATSDFDTTGTPLVSQHGVFDKYWSFVSSAYTNDTTDAGNSTSADTQMVTSSGDIAYFGKSENFDALSWDVSTSGASGTIAWEYCSAVDVSTVCTTWSTLTLTTSANPNFTGDGSIAFTSPSDWVAAKVNSELTAYFYVRARVTGNFTTSPVGVQIVAIPATTSLSASRNATGDSARIIWTENTGSPKKVRSTSYSVTTSSLPASSAELSPKVMAYSSIANAAATQPSNMRHLVRTSDGTLHAFVRSGVLGACGGATSNDIGLVWIYSTDSGTTWTCGGQVSSDTSTNLYASAVVDSSDNIYIVYSAVANNGGTTLDVAFRKLSKGAGSTWTLGSAHDIVSGSATIGYAYANIELEGTTRIWMVARYYDGANYQDTVYYSNGMSPTSSGNWTQSIANLETAGNASNQHFPSIVRYGSKIGVIYTDQTSNRLKWRTRTDGDTLTSWAAEAEVISTALSAGSMPSSVGNASGNVYMSITNSTSTLFSYFNGSSWSTVATASSASKSNSGSTVITNGTDVWVFYLETTGLITGQSGNAKLVYKKAVSPFATANFDSSSTQVISYHGVLDKYWSYVSSAYTNDTTDSGNTTTADTQMVTATGDIAYFGKTVKFDTLSWVLSTSGVGGNLVWEYYNGSTWAPVMDFMGLSNHNLLGSGYVSFIPPSDWATTAVNGEGTPYYYVRARVTTTYSTPPVASQVVSIPNMNHPTAVGLSSNLHFIWAELASTPSRVRYSSVSFNANPNAPSSLGPSSLVDGSFSSDNTPSLSFSLSDSDGSDTVRYQVQIDDSSDFSSPVVDYTSALAAQGAAAFTVGQAVGSGSYTTGSASQTLSDGSYYWRVRATDNNGATGSYSTANSGSIAFKIDATAPSTPGTPATTTPTNDTTPSWTWTASTDGGSGLASPAYTVEWSQDSGFNGGVSSSSSVTNSFTHSSALAEGTWYFRVKAYDAVSNVTGYSSNGTVVIDTTNPTAPGTPSTTSPTNSGTQDWSWSAASDALSGIAHYAWRITTSVGAAVSNGTTALTNYTSSLAQGAYIFFVKTVDNAGNESSETSSTVTVDTTAPTTPGTPSTTTPTNDTTPTWTWTASTDSGGAGLATTPYTVQWSQDSGFGSGISTSTSATNSFTHSSTLSAGTWYFRVKAADAVTNESSYSSNGTVVIDLTAPTTPGTPATTSPTADTTPSWTWTASSDGGGAGLAGTPYTVEWSQDSGFGSGVSSSTSATNSFTHSTTLAGGTWYFRVKAADAAGNESSYSSNGTVVIDLISPTTPGSPTTISPTTDTTPAWTWTASTDSGGAGLATTPYTVQWSQDSGFGSGISTSTSATNSFTHSSTLAEGTWYFRVKAADTLGNESSYSSNGTVVIDLTAPTTPGTPATTTPTVDTTPTWTWTASTDSGSGLATDAYTVQWSQNSGFGSGVSTSTSTTNSFTHSSTLSAGTWYFRVKATDAASNESSYSSNGSVEITASSTPPTGSIAINNGGEATSSRTVTLNLATTDDSDSENTIEMKLSENSNFTGASYESFAASKTWTLSNGDGQKTVYVVFRDSSSNVSSTYSDTIILDTTGPLGIELSSPGHQQYIAQERPTFRWKTTTDATTSISKYKLEVEYGFDDAGISNQTFAIDDIPASRTEKFETSKYVIEYQNFSDSDDTNNYIALYTKSSSEWGSNDNDGKLREGKRVWKVLAFDAAGNTTTSTRELFIDRKAPTLENIALNGQLFTGKAFVTNSTRPTITGILIDTPTNSTSQKLVTAGPKSVEVLTEKKSVFGYQRISVATVNLEGEPEYSCYNNSGDSHHNDCIKKLKFNYKLSNSLTYGQYKLTITGQDHASNNSVSTTLLVTVTASNLADAGNVQISTPTPTPKPSSKPVESTPTPATPSPEPESTSSPDVTSSETTLSVEPPQPSFSERTELFFNAIGSSVSSVFGTVGKTIAQGVDGLTRSSSGAGRLIVDSLVATTTTLAKGTTTIYQNISNGTGWFFSSTYSNIASSIKNTKDTIASATFSVASSLDNRADRLSNGISFAIVKFGYLFATEPTKIYNVAVKTNSATSATISWETNHPATSKVNYGLDETYPLDSQSTKRVTHHEITLENLQPNTEYHFEVMSQNNNYVYDANRRFTTPAEE